MIARRIPARLTVAAAESAVSVNEFASGQGPTLAVS